MVAYEIENRRRSGCTDRCERLAVLVIGGSGGRRMIEVHDLDGHEAAIRAEYGPPPVIDFGRLKLDTRMQRATVDGVDAGLSVTEWRLLEYLAARSGKLCRDDDIVRALWGEHTSGNILRTLLSRLRSKLGPCGILIQTQSGFGLWMPEADGDADYGPLKPPRAARVNRPVQVALFRRLEHEEGSWVDLEALLAAARSSWPRRRACEIVRSLHRLAQLEPRVVLRTEDGRLQAAMLRSEPET